jgi:hypothetical protein
MKKKIIIYAFVTSTLTIFVGCLLRINHVEGNSSTVLLVSGALHTFLGVGLMLTSRA